MNWKAAATSIVATVAASALYEFWLRPQIAQRDRRAANPPQTDDDGGWFTGLF